MSDQTEISPPNDGMETPPPVEEIEAFPTSEPPESEAKRPVLTVHVYSWVTPILGLVMLIVGLFAGYFGRPLIKPAASSPTKVVQATTGPQNTRAANSPSLKDVVVAQTRHFMGDPNAPVTIVEFSDFQ